MAASVRIAFGDPRFQLLGSLCGLPPHLAEEWALGAALESTAELFAMRVVDRIRTRRGG